MGTKQFASINQTQIDQIENNTVETGNLVTDVQSAVDRVEQSVQTIQDTDLSNVDTHVLTNTNKIDNVKADTNALRTTDIPNVQADISTVKTDVANVETIVTNNQDKLNGLATNTQDIMGDTSRIETDTQNIETRVIDVQNSQDRIESRATRIEGDTQDIQGKVKSLEGTFRNNDEGSTLYGETFLNITGAGVLKGLLNEGATEKTIYIQIDNNPTIQMFTFQINQMHTLEIRFNSSLKVNASSMYSDFKGFYTLD